MGVPVAIAGLGVLILVLNALPAALAATIAVLAIVCAVWTWTALLLYRAYGPALVDALRRRRLLDPDAELEATVEDAAIARRLLVSGDARSARLGLELASTLDAPAIAPSSRARRRSAGRRAAGRPRGPDGVRGRAASGSTGGRGRAAATSTDAAIAAAAAPSSWVSWTARIARRLAAARRRGDHGARCRPRLDPAGRRVRRRAGGARSGDPAVGDVGDGGDRSPRGCGRALARDAPRVGTSRRRRPWPHEWSASRHDSERGARRRPAASRRHRDRELGRLVMDRLAGPGPSAG